MSTTGIWTRASEARADSLCPGRWQAQRQVAVRPSSPDAQWGQVIHRALESGDTTGLTVDQRDIYDSCRAIEQSVLAQYFGPDTPGASERAWREMEFTLEQDGYEHRGHPDVVYRFGHRALILDHKTLPGEQAQSMRHEQLRDYAVLVANNFALIDQVCVAVIQPLVTRSPILTVYDRDALALATQQMWDRIRASRAANPPRIAGKIQCQYCAARNHCTPYQQWAGAELPVTRSILEVPVAAWQPEQRRLFCDQFGVAQKWLDETWDAMVAGALVDPEFVPGYQMKPGASFLTQQAHVLRTEQVQEIFNRFQAMGGTLEQFMSCVGVINAAFKEAIAKVSGLTGKDLERKYKELVGDLVTVRQNAPSLKPVKNGS